MKNLILVVMLALCFSEPVFAYGYHGKDCRDSNDCLDPGRLNSSYEEAQISTLRAIVFEIRDLNRTLVFKHPN